MRFFLLMLVLTGLPFAGNALADGMLLSAPYYYVAETAQQAIIRHDDNTSTETLTIMPHFEGDANEFAWVVPLPSLPQVTAGDPDLFRELDEMTRPLQRRRDGDWSGCHTDADYLIGASDNGGVQIIEALTVGYYQILTVEADSAPALLDSLEGWGFLHEGNIEQASSLIDDYVQRDWAFATVRIDTASFQEIFEPGWYGEYFGQLQPLTFSFTSEEMIYPMRISALSAAETSEVVLYVVDDHRRDFPGARTRYANRFSAAELENLAYRGVAHYLEEGEFLTHLRRDFSPAEMNEDIVLVRATDDEEFWQVIYSGMPWMTVGLLGGPVLWFTGRRLKGVSRRLRAASCRRRGTS